MLIDKYINRYHYRKYHDINVAANIEDTYEGILRTDFSRSMIVKLLFRLRGMNPNFTTLKCFEDMGFVKLGETANKEIIFGIISNSPSFSGCLHMFRPQEFVEYDSGIKAAINFSVHYINGSTSKVSTETRVFCTTKKMKKRFSIYWFFISPFSSLIRYLFLKQIKMEVQRKKVSLITT